MAAAAKEESGPINGEYRKPDAGLAFRIYNQEIAPRLTKSAEERGETAEPYKRIKDQANFPKTILNFLVKLADEEDAKRDHFLLALNEGMKHLGLFMPSDLVTQAQGVPKDASVIPMGERPKPKLAFQMDRKVEKGDGVDADLADAGDVVIPMGGGDEQLANAIGLTVADGEVADLAASDTSENIAGMAAPEASPDDGLMIVSVKGYERHVHYSSKVPPKNMSIGQIWHDAKSDVFWTWTAEGMKSYKFEDAE